MEQSDRRAFLQGLALFWAGRYLGAAGSDERDKGTSEMSDGVWICYSLGGLESLGKVTSDWMESKDDRKLVSAVKRANSAGEAVTRDAFPPEIYGQVTAKEADYNFTDFFIANALPVVSDRLATVLRRFDLGDASLYPVPVLKKDKATPVDGDWHFLNFGNVKHAFIPEQSGGSGFEQIEGTDYWIMGGYGKHDAIAVSTDALSGPDIWVEPRCVSVFFLSNRVVSAIKAEGLTGFDVVKCKVV
ncbi:MAG: hypothetical protein WBA51_11015 [Erythrobacter sp.]